MKETYKAKPTMGNVILMAFESLQGTLKLRLDANNTSIKLTQKEKIDNITEPELEYFRNVIRDYKRNKMCSPERLRSLWEKANYLFPELEKVRHINDVITKLESELLKNE